MIGKTYVNNFGKFSLMNIHKKILDKEISMITQFYQAEEKYLNS